MRIDYEAIWHRRINYGVLVFIEVPGLWRRASRVLSLPANCADSILVAVSVRL